MWPCQPFEQNLLINIYLRIFFVTRKEMTIYFIIFVLVGLTKVLSGMIAGNHSLYVMCCNIAPTIRRAS